MIPAIAIIISAYAVARLLCIMVDQRNSLAYYFRALVVAAAIVIIIWQCLDVMALAVKFTDNYPGLFK
jgi:hypothetical protein